MNTGEQLKQAGIETVTANNYGWINLALDQCNMLPLRSIMPWQEIRVFITARCGEPEHANAWGALARQLRSLGVIEEVAKTKAHYPASHARETAVFKIASRWEWT